MPDFKREYSAYCAAVQIDATLYDHQSETRTGAICDVLPTMEGTKEPLLAPLALTASRRAHISEQNTAHDG